MNDVAVLCVYYKVDAAQHADRAVQVRQFQARLLQRWPGLGCQLLQRPEATAGFETWMETYRCGVGMGATLSTALIDDIECAAAAAGLPAPRHSEPFMALR